MTEAIIVAVLGLVGTLAGSYLANRKSAALVAYRLEQLEQKVNKHNNLIERTYALEESVALMDERVKVANHRIEDLEKDMLTDYPALLAMSGKNDFREVGKMTEQQLRQAVVDTILGWVGCNEADGSHKKIIDIYNSHKPLARGYALKYTDAWCAGTVSAVAIVNNITDIMPTEVGVGKMIDLYKKLGRWMESDGYTPQLGDVCMYAWSDDGSGECTSGADHVGIVTKVSGTTFWVTEGNYSDSVKTRTMQVNGRYIRGFGLPDYAGKATGVASSMPEINDADVFVSPKLRQLKKGVKDGGDVKAMQTLLIVGGYSCGTQGADGSFGNSTDAAVRKYQSDHGLTADGVVGAVTWGRLLGM